MIMIIITIFTIADVIAIAASVIVFIMTIVIIIVTTIVKVALEKFDKTTMGGKQ